MTSRHRRPTLAEIESEYIREILDATKGNKAEAARILGISRKNLYERLAREEEMKATQTAGKVNSGGSRTEV